MLFLDVDRFKHVNDGLGHDAGDVLLRELAAPARRTTVRPSDVVARFGGDEFTVLCAGLDPTRAEEQARELARRLLEAIERPLHLDGEDRRLSASLGIAMAGPASTPEGLLHDADAAMYEAKQRGKARFEVFDDDMRSSLHARLDLEARLERAIEREEFRLVVQPIVDLPTGRCVAAEALLRWQDPEFGLVTPDAFIGLAEDTGLIIPIGEWALAEACRTVAPLGGRRAARARVHHGGEPLGAPGRPGRPRRARAQRHRAQRTDRVAAVPRDHRERADGGVVGRWR